MEKIRIAVCDDDRFAADTITAAVTNLFEEQNIPVEVSRFVFPRVFLEYCEEHLLDLVYLDIEMPELDGLSLGRTLRSMPTSPEIIYVSNREDAVFSALKVHPFGFVRKGHFMKDVQDITHAYIDQLQKTTNQKKIVVTTGEGYRNIPVLSIRYFEGNGAYQDMYIESQKEPIRIRSRMKALEDQLLEEGFLRIHKGFLVNHRFITRISTDTVVMDQGENLPVSRGKGQELKSAYLKLVRESGGMLF